MRGSPLSFRKAAPPVGGPPLPPWKLLIVDDEADVHAITELSLGQFRFDGRPLQFLHAHTASDGFDRFADHPDVAVALVDVVMEHEQAGLDLVRRVRGELGNALVRLVLRTGQPGSAPETDVIAGYEINDYKEKTDLSAAKLSTLMVTSLRAFRDLKRLDTSRRGLERILDGALDLAVLRTPAEATAAMLEQLGDLLRLDEGGFYAQVDSLAAGRNGRIEIMAGSGRFAGLAGRPIDDVLPADAVGRIRRSIDTGEADAPAGDYLGLLRTGDRIDRLLYLKGFDSRSAIDRAMLDRFSRQVGLCFAAAGQRPK